MRLSIPPGARMVYTWAGWTLYELPQRPGDSPLWRAFKVMLDSETPAMWGRRRSFVLTWNPLTLRLRKDRDRYALEMGLPDLYERVELMLTLAYGPEWLRASTGLTERQIKAEAARLANLARERRRAARKRSPKPMRAPVP